MTNYAEGGGYRWQGLPCRTLAEEESVNGFKHGINMTEICVLNLASVCGRAEGLQTKRSF